MGLQDQVLRILWRALPLLLYFRKWTTIVACFGKWYRGRSSKKCTPKAAIFTRLFWEKENRPGEEYLSFDRLKIVSEAIISDLEFNVITLSQLFLSSRCLGKLTA